MSGSSLEKSLVSIGVITYNSENTILDTLESIEKINYENLEIVISDDGSKDRTLEIIENWKENNINSFKNIKILKISKNTGSTQNIQRCLENISGEYVKFIAGDDILLKNCIDLYINLVNNKKANIIFSKMQEFQENKDKKILGKVLFFVNLIKCKNVKEQYKYFLRERENIAPTLFFKTDFLKKIGGFDDKNYFLLEDVPLLLKITKLGYKLEYLDEITVLYRRHFNSVTTQVGKYMNPILQKDLEKVFYNEIYPELKKGNFIDKLYLWDGVLENYISKKIIKNGNKKNSKYKILKLLSPVRIINGIKSIK